MRGGLVPGSKFALAVGYPESTRPLLSPSISYDDQPAGSVALGGSLSGVHSASETVTGTVSLAGTATEGQSHSNMPTGSVTLSGSLTVAAQYAETPTGSITLSGTSTSSSTHAAALGGTLTLTGSISEVLTEPPSGTVGRVWTRPDPGAPFGRATRGRVGRVLV